MANERSLMFLKKPLPEYDRCLEGCKYNAKNVRKEDRVVHFARGIGYRADSVDIRSHRRREHSRDACYRVCAGDYRRNGIANS